MTEVSNGTDVGEDKEKMKVKRVFWKDRNIKWTRKQKVCFWLLLTLAYTSTETHHYSIYAYVPDAGAEVAAGPTACEPVSCEAASAQPCSFHQHSLSHCSVQAPGDWTEDGERERERERKKVVKHVVGGEVDGKEAGRLTNTIYLIVKSRFVS